MIPNRVRFDLKSDTDETKLNGPNEKLNFEYPLKAYDLSASDGFKLEVNPDQDQDLYIVEVVDTEAEPRIKNPKPSRGRFRSQTSLENLNGRSPSKFGNLTTSQNLNSSSSLRSNSKRSLKRMQTQEFVKLALSEPKQTSAKFVMSQLAEVEKSIDLCRNLSHNLNICYNMVNRSPTEMQRVIKKLFLKMGDQKYLLEDYLHIQFSKTDPFGFRTKKPYEKVMKLEKSTRSPPKKTGKKQDNLQQNI